MEWRKEILEGIDVLPKIGHPGRIVVYGKHAEPILTGDNDKDVMVAAAEFGNGRIIVIAERGYSDNFLENENSPDNAMKTFHENMKKWLTRGTYKKGNSIINAKDRVSEEKLMSSKIVISDGGHSSITPMNMIEYVRNGGALFHCLTPWIWLHHNKGKTLSDVSYVSLLGEAGIQYIDEYTFVPEDGFSVNENKAEGAHLMRVLDEVGTDFNKAVEKSNMYTNVKYLPKGEFPQLSPIVEKILETCTEEIKKKTVPSPTVPASDERDKAMVNIWLACNDFLQPPNIKAPGVNLFPGDFSTEPPMKSHTFEFYSDREDFHSTGCYLPAGQTLKVEVISGNEEQDWKLLIGCHTDELQGDAWKRWPKVNKKVTLAQKSLELSTPFGGLIYLISPEKPSRSISVKLENVVDSPSFRLTEGEKGKETWEDSRQSPGLWADIAGEFVMITIQASNVREMEFDALTSVMKFWDSVVRLYHDLRGTDESKFRRMWFVTDEQPSGGYMHAGYPIVTGLDVADPKGNYFLLNGSVLQEEGQWSAFHEIGHNMERDEWTYEGTDEVTSNIFTLCAMDVICHQKPWIHKVLQRNLNATEQFFKDAPDFEKWKSCGGAATFVYAQLARDFGWESFRKVFRRYEAMTEDQKPKDNQMKMDMWFSIFSEVVELNLSPFASFWTIPLSEETVARLQTAFPVGFLPDDEVIRFATERVDEVLRKFPGTIRER